MPQLFRKILCPVDFDDNSMAALDLACKIAAQNDAALCLMHVVPFPLAASEIGPLPSESLPVWEHGAQVKLEQIGRERIPSSLRCEIASRSGQPVEAIIGAETELSVDLVVMATQEDLDQTEEGGRLPMAQPEKVSEHAYQRGRTQLGTLGSGNRFLEVSRVDQIYQPRVAEALGLELGQVTLLIHSGSPGSAIRPATIT